MNETASEARRLVLLASISFGALAGASPLLAAGPTFTVNTPGDAKDGVLDGVCETDTGNHTCSLRADAPETR